MVAARPRSVALSRIAAGARAPRTSSAWARSMTPLVPIPQLARGRRTCWSRTRGGCRPVRSRRAASSWRCRWRRSWASRRSRCRPTAMPARRWRPMRPRAASRRSIFCPDDTPAVNVREIALQGAQVYRVNGLIDDCGAIVGKGAAEGRWFDMSTLKEPYRIEGKKTMGLELAEQLGWQLPDVIFYPTGGGTGLIGMWKAFDELEALGWIGPKRPRMVAVQAAGCAPIVRLRGGRRACRRAGRMPRTVAAGIRVPQGGRRFPDPAGGARRAAAARWRSPTRRSRLRGASVPREDGVLLCPEGGATLPPTTRRCATAGRSPDERVVLFNCATRFEISPAAELALAAATATSQSTSSSLRTLIYQPCVACAIGCGKRRSRSRVYINGSH